MVLCRIMRSSRKKPDGRSLDLLRTLSIPSPYQVLVFAGFAGFAGVCFSIFLVGEIFFPSWEGVIVSLGCGEENLRGIRGQRPHGRRAPSPCRVGACALEEVCIEQHDKL